jgi:hypothetical protein
MQRALAFDNSPVLAAPLRFFLNVPIFAVLAATLLLWAGPQALGSRWSPFTLALTHLFTLGVLASAMTGALIQILPVATGVSIPKAGMNATVIHALLTLGTLALTSAFLLAAPLLYGLALVLLSASFAWLLAVCAIGFWLCRNKILKGAREVLIAVCLALIALLATVILGTVLASALAWNLPLPLPVLVDLHGSWGLLGWVGLLIIGIAYQVMPIFQVTELYPRQITHNLAPLIFALLAIWSISALVLGPTHPASLALTQPIAAAYVAFSVVTFYLLWTRKRPKADTTTLFWRTAMISLSVCVLIRVLQTASNAHDFSVTLGILFIVGVALSAINGMLYKIIPFLLWYNAQKSLAIALRIVPKVKNIIPDEVARKQFWAHLLALVLLLAASQWPAVFTRAAALTLALSAAWLGRNMLNAVRLYLYVKREIAAIQATQDTR